MVNNNNNVNNNDDDDDVVRNINVVVVMSLKVSNRKVAKTVFHRFKLVQEKLSKIPTLGQKRDCNKYQY